MWVALFDSISDPTKLKLRDCSRHPPSALECSSTVMLADAFDGRTVVRLLAEDADDTSISTLPVISTEKVTDCKSDDSATLCDALAKLQKQINFNETFPLEVRREFCLMDAMAAVELRGFNPAVPPLVEFLGEEAIDTGSVRRELWRLLGRNARGSLFTGSHNRCIPTHSVQHLRHEYYRKFGMLMSMAVIQDGIGFPFFAPCAYEYLCGKAATEIRPEISDIPDEDFRTLALQVSQATDSLSPVYSDDKTIQKLVEVGYTKPVSHSHQEEILHSIAVHHCLLTIKAELDQLRDGLRTLGLLQSLERYPSLFETLFIAKNTSSMTAVTIKRILKKKEFSEKGSLSRLHEESTYMNFCRYLEDVEGGAVEETLCDLLAFFTACEMVPVMGLDPEPTLCFNEHDIFPTASTCAHQLVLPTRYHDDEQKFKAAMSTGLQFYGGYGKK